jgi:hypothetical protein
MAGHTIADLNRAVPVATQLGDDLLIQPALVVLACQEQVGALLDGELRNADEVCSRADSKSEVGAFYWTVPATDIVNSGREEQG